MDMSDALIEWIQVDPDREEYIGMANGERCFFISMVGYKYKCVSLPTLPVRSSFFAIDGNLNKLKQRANVEFYKEYVSG